MIVAAPDADDAEGSHLVAAIDFMGEIRRYGSDAAAFQRGVSSYPIDRQSHHPAGDR